MRNFLFILCSVSLVFAVSCEKPEKLWDKPNVPAGIQTQVFGMGENYENQLWFEFSSQNTATNHHDIWDIAFASDDRHVILVNGGKNAFFSVAKFQGADFNSFTSIDIKKTVWDFDNPSGESDSMVMDGWCEKSGPGKYTGKGILYVFDLGEDSLGLARYIKLKILSRDNGVYHINWGLLSDTVATHDEFLRTSESKNYIYYNFTQQKEVYNEMLDKNNWDIVFTTYKKWIPDEFGTPTAYVLRGVISNPNNVRVAELTGKNNFDDIDITILNGLAFSSAYDEIGYDWKLWSFTANKYTVDQSKIYIIQDSKGDYYKMKFVDFYDDLGRKGYPKMAWEHLK